MTAAPDVAAAGDAATGHDQAALAQRPALGPGLRLQWEPAQGCHVLLYPEGMVKLNGSAGEIMTRCDGQRSVAEIITLLETEFATSGLTADVLGFVAIALQRHWLVDRAPRPSTSAPGQP